MGLKIKTFHYFQKRSEEDDLPLTPVDLLLGSWRPRLHPADGSSPGLAALHPPKMISLIKFFIKKANNLRKRQFYRKNNLVFAP